MNDLYSIIISLKNQFIMKDKLIFYCYITVNHLLSEHHQFLCFLTYIIITRMFIDRKWDILQKSILSRPKTSLVFLGEFLLFSSFGETNALKGISHSTVYYLCFLVKYLANYCLASISCIRNFSEVVSKPRRVVYSF